MSRFAKAARMHVSMLQDPSAQTARVHVRLPLAHSHSHRRICARPKPAQSALRAKASTSPGPNQPKPLQRQGQVLLSTPTHNSASPRESSAKASHGQYVSWLDLAFPHGLIERKGYAGRAGVAVFCEVADDLLGQCSNSSEQYAAEGVHQHNACDQTI